ncbi:hypothetical protein H4I96_09477 [Botrytis cinerea]
MRVFFDVRTDSDALYAHFGVALQGVEDVQLMESATRATTSSRKYLNGLAKCIEQSGLDSRDLTSWKLAKEKGERLFKVQFGGSYEVFEQRPIRNHIISYCVGDVQHLPKLRSRYYSRTSRWRDLVGRESKKRVEESQKPEYQPHGPERTLAPWSEDRNKSLNAWNYVPPTTDIFDDDYGRNDEEEYEEEYEFDDDGPTSDSDIINDCGHHLYYSD